MAGEPLMIFGNIYAGRRVLVTGHTGFKGSWLTSWLLRLGAIVAGISKDCPTTPAMFETLGLAARVQHIWGDVRDLAVVQRVVQNVRPEFVFHLAAQAIVAKSYTDPVETITTNIMGTMNVLESLRILDQPCVAVLVTSDKSYDNVECVWGYREADRLGGKDIYSGSKGGAELVIRSYLHSFFQNESVIRLAIGRAGNVIGGGDWAQDRIVADCVRAWSAGNTVEIRSPNSTRPWQHVLEPLSGYLALGHAASQNPLLHGEAFNFGPRAEQNRTVVELLVDLGRYWGLSTPGQMYRIAANHTFHEAALLKLNCDKAMFHLQWEPNLAWNETIRLVGEWYSAFHNAQTDMYAFTVDQIAAYERMGVDRNRKWTRS